MSIGYAKAQSQNASFKFRLDSTTITSDTCTAITGNLKVYNLTNHTIGLVWRRTFANGWPSNPLNPAIWTWTVATCDNNGCYGVTTTQMPFSIAANDSATISMTVNNNHVPGGNGIINLEIDSSGSLSHINAKFVVKVSTLCTTGMSSVAASNSSIKVYPSPFNNSFNVELTGISKPKFVEMYNVIGALVFKKELATDDNSYSITPSNLPKGLYFVSFSDSERKIIATKRIQKD